MNSHLLNRIFLVIVGTILMGLGIEMIVIANQGFDSVSTLILGLMNYSTLPFGRWSQLISLGFLLITFFYKRSMLGIGSIINTLLVGETISWAAPYLEGIVLLKDSLVASFLGFVVMALGSGPLEGMMFCTCELLGLSLQKGRIVLDFVIVAGGLLLKSSVGIGTLFAIILLGPMIQGFMLILQKRVRYRYRDGEIL